MLWILCRRGVRMRNGEEGVGRRWEVKGGCFGDEGW